MCVFTIPKYAVLTKLSYPLCFIEQHPIGTKRSTHVNAAVKLGAQQDGPTFFSDIVFKERGVHGGMYPRMVPDADGDETL